MKTLPHLKIGRFLSLITLVLIGINTQAQEKLPTNTQKIVEQGIAIEFTADPVAKNATSIKAGEDVDVKFKVTDTTTGTPVKGLGLSAWISLRPSNKATEPAQCREQIQSYLTGSMRNRPDVDLNSYYVLALNKSADISVIDPLLGYGGSKLLTLVMLKSPGEDWLLTRDRERIFVTLPLINQVAVVETRTWKVTDYIDAGTRPTRIVAQPDQQYVWVTNNTGVTVIDAATLKVAAMIPTGVGQHDLVVSNDNRFAFVSNRENGSVSIIDIRQLAKIKDLAVGAGLVSMSLSELSKALYVANENDGTVTVIEAQTQEILARMKTKPGARSVRFAPGGRYGFVLNTKQSSVHIFDAASNRILHEVNVGKSPDQIMFSETFAFVRSLETENVEMLRLATIGKEVDITEFPGGQAAPGQGSTPIRADSIVLAPEGNAVIVANPVDQTLYYYAEGMAAPMGNFQNYRREPLAAMVVDRSLRETKPGIYSTTIKLPSSGSYDVAFLNDSPRVSHCFDISAAANPGLKEKPAVALKIEHQLKQMKLEVGHEFTFRFKLIETATGHPKSDLKDVRVLTFLSPGTWQRRDTATSVGDGVYELKISVPETGLYMLFVESSSMGVRFIDLPYLMLQATE